MKTLILIATLLLQSCYLAAIPDSSNEPELVYNPMTHEWTYVK